MPSIQLKLEVSPSPSIAFWKVTVAAKSPPNSPLVLHGPVPDFPPINTKGFYVLEKQIDADGPTLNIDLNISNHDPAFGASCRVTINTVIQDHVLICKNGAEDDDYNYSLPSPARAVVAAPAAVGGV
jgi:hypothetical protein